MQKIIDMYKYCVENDNTPLLPPFEADPDNPAWYDFFANTFTALFGLICPHVKIGRFQYGGRPYKFEII